MTPTGCLTWALVIVVVSFCSGYQLAGYLEADKTERAAAALRCAQEALAASRAEAYTAREFSARLLAEAVAARRDREAAEAQCGLVDITVSALWRPASDRQQRRGAEPTPMACQAQDRPETALGRSQEAPDPAIHPRHLTYGAEPGAGR